MAGLLISPQTLLRNDKCGEVDPVISGRTYYKMSQSFEGNNTQLVKEVAFEMGFECYIGVQ
jgi:hypothetical protein